MRALQSLIAGMLLLIAIAGLGFGVLAVIQAVRHANDPQAGLGVFMLLEMAVVPFAVGAMALGALGIMVAVDNAKEEHTSLLTRIATNTTQVATNTVRPDPAADATAAANVARGDIYSK
jgi:hypothetical protein